jgi:hypothetical protein
MPLVLLTTNVRSSENDVVSGVGRWRPPLGRVPVSDGVGIVVAAGTDVSRIKIGDRVSPIFYPKWLEGRVAAEKMEHALGGAAADGVLAEYTVFDEASVIRVPAHLTDEEAATLPCAGVAGWNALLSGRSAIQKQLRRPQGSVTGSRHLVRKSSTDEMRVCQCYSHGRTDNYRVAGQPRGCPALSEPGVKVFPSPGSSPSNASLGETRFRKDADDEPGHGTRDEVKRSSWHQWNRPSHGGRSNEGASL